MRIAVLMLSAAAGACGYHGGPLSQSAKTGYCPVCKMKVSSDGPLACQILFSDETKLMFESPGDMIIYYQTPETYGLTVAQRDRAGISRMIVRDYKTNEMLEVESATLVYKSRVKGPMGYDVLAFKNHGEAASFVDTNGGTIAVLSEITPEMIRDLRK